jgi:hypothetical protein
MQMMLRSLRVKNGGRILLFLMKKIKGFAPKGASAW